MAPEDLLRLIEQGENSGVEFKRDALRPEQLAREVVAFANFQGGRLLIGVEDSGTGQMFRAQPGLIEVFMERAQPFLSEETAELVEHLRRERRWFYPPEAVRECLLNAVAHRDWTRPAEIEVVRYGNRLTVTSPGALQNAMTIVKMLAGQRSARNPIIVEVLRDYGYVDARGMGVRRKIVPLVHAYTGNQAIFEATDDFLRITLPAKRFHADCQ